MKKQEESISFEANICQMSKYFVLLHNEGCSRARMSENRQHNTLPILLIGKASKRNLCAHAGVTVRKVKSGKFKLNRKERIMSRWSKLQKELYLITDPEIKMQVHCVVYPMRSQWGCTDLPRYWITLDKEIIFDYPKDFPFIPDGHVAYPYVTDVSDISDLMREYIDTPASELMTRRFDNDRWGLTDILRAADRRIGQRRLEQLKETAGPAAMKVVAARIKKKNRIPIPRCLHRKGTWYWTDLSQEVTGINATIWACVKFANDSPILIAATTEGDAVMSIEDEPKILNPKKCKKIPCETLDALKRWIVLNEQILLQHWELDTSSVGLIYGVRNIRTKKYGMDLSNLKDIMRPFKDAGPSVGIFWVDVEKQDLRDVQSSQLGLTGKETGNLTHRYAHRDLWQKRRNSAKRKKEQGLPYDSYYLQDYSLIPRGRVWYNADTGKYFVAVGEWYKELEEWLRPLLADEFDIPEDFEFVVGEHWMGMGL